MVKNLYGNVQSIHTELTNMKNGPLENVKSILNDVQKTVSQDLKNEIKDSEDLRGNLASEKELVKKV